VKEEIKKAAEIICQSSRTVALTGAGISVESGIPHFRGSGGLWERYDPMEYGTIQAFLADPEKVWTMLHEVSALINKAQPNPAHEGLARLEKMGKLHHIITQNIDNLHQAAGSTGVIEFHGNCETLVCLSCDQYVGADEPEDGLTPTCSCGAILKPNVVFFGEQIPSGALQEAYALVSSCHVLMVVGTSAEVTPANTIPYTAKMAKAKIVEINRSPTVLTESLTDIFLQGKASEAITELVYEVERIVSQGQVT
jgi:NAD-dependent deacetylase